MASDPYRYRHIGTYATYRVYAPGSSQIIGRVSWVNDEWLAVLDGAPERTGCGKTRRKAIEAAGYLASDYMPLKAAAQFAGVPYPIVKGWARRGVLPTEKRAGTNYRYTTPEHVRRCYQARGAR